MSDMFITGYNVIAYYFLRSSLGLQGLNSNNISEFFEAIQNAESLGLYSKMFTLRILVITRSY